MTRRTLTIFGGPVHVLVRQTCDGWECKFDPLRNYADTRSDLIAWGYGETESDAVRGYIRECHRLERLPIG